MCVRVCRCETNASLICLSLLWLIILAPYLLSHVINSFNLLLVSSSWYYCHKFCLFNSAYVFFLISDGIKQWLEARDSWTVRSVRLSQCGPQTNFTGKKILTSNHPSAWSNWSPIIKDRGCNKVLSGQDYRTASGAAKDKYEAMGETEQTQ
jgi:hypothetical protein